MSITAVLLHNMKRVIRGVEISLSYSWPLLISVLIVLFISVRLYTIHPLINIPYASEPASLNSFIKLYVLLSLLNCIHY